MAQVVFNPRSLPQKSVQIPGAKPAVTAFPYKDVGHPEEVDSFRLLVRELRREKQILLEPKK
jgi:hypothetical protein